MDALRWEQRPKLRQPVLIASFEGWNDAGEAASLAGRWLATAWGARRFATLDPEEFYDFTVTRPNVRIVDGESQHIDWPMTTFETCVVPTKDTDVVFLHAVEPQLRWRTYCAAVTGLAVALDCKHVITLGSLLAEVAHTRPVRITGSAIDRDMSDRLGISRSNYEGPTGIVGVLSDACTRAGIPTTSLWATIPHYVSQTQSPKAALALVERLADLFSAPTDVTELRLATTAYEERVAELVCADEDAAAYVEQLETADENDEVRVGFEFDEELKLGTGLAAEAEIFLRDQSND